MARTPWKNIRRTGRWYQVHAIWAESESFRDLRPVARCLLHELLLINNPGINGDLNMDVRTAAKRVGCSKTSAAKAFNELIDHGFLALIEESSWINGRARAFRLTMMQVGNRKPSDEWAAWKK